MQSRLKCRARGTSGGLLWEWPGKASDTDTVQSPEHGLHSPLFRVGTGGKTSQNRERTGRPAPQPGPWQDRTAGPSARTLIGPDGRPSARTLTGRFIRWPSWGARKGQSLQFGVSGKQQGSSSLPLELLRLTSFPRKKKKNYVTMTEWMEG